MTKVVGEKVNELDGRRYKQIVIETDKQDK